MRIVEKEFEKRIYIVFIINTLFILAMFISLFNYWQGDSSIYQVYAKNIAEGRGQVFNDEFSSGATSPLWAWILSLGYLISMPLFYAKFVVLLLLVGYTFLFREFTFLTSASLYLITKMAMYGYEIALFFFVIGLVWYAYKKESKWLLYALMLLPLIRPESIILLPLIAWLRKDSKLLLAIIPFIVYSAYSFNETGYFSTSGRSRLEYLFEFGIYDRRYFFVFIPIIIYFLRKIRFNWLFYIPLLILLVPIWDSTKVVNRLDFDTITQKGIGNYIDSGKVLCYEVQIKYWLNKTKVISMDGITDGNIFKFESVNEMIKTMNFDYIIITGAEKKRNIKINLSAYDLIVENKYKPYHAYWEKIFRKRNFTLIKDNFH